MLVNTLQKGMTSKKLPLYISGSANQNTANATSLSISSPAGVQAGDLLIAFVASYNTSVDFPAVAGWTEVFDSGGITVKYKVATTTDGSGAFTVSTPTLLSGAIVVFRYANYDGVSTGVTAVNNPLTSANINASVPNCVLLAYVDKYIGNVSISSSQMDSLLVFNNDSDSPSFAVFMKNLSAAGWVGTKAFIVGTSGTYGDAILVTIKPQ